MKILQIIYESPGSPFGFGGAGVRASEIYRRLTCRHEVTLLCMKYPGASDGEIQGLRHIFVGAGSPDLAKSVLSYTMKAAAFVRRHGDDFDVIVENFLPSTPFCSGFFTRTPVVLQVQGIMEQQALSKFPLYYGLPMYLVERFYPSWYHRFIFVSPVTKDKVMRRVMGRVDYCAVIPNGVNAGLLEATPLDGDYILFFSRIDSHTKGLDLLISAFTALADRYPGIRLVLAGYEFDRFSSVVLKVPPHVRKLVSYAGFVAGDEKTALLSGARVVVLPSRHESQPVSLLEAAACAKPVVVSDIPELAFVGENQFGLSFPAGSDTGLREKLARVLDDEILRRQLGAAGRVYARQFLWDGLAQQFENALQLTANGKK
ncbi:MAG: glycosyltransferase family 4 protein [Thermodesulfovibrionales bacterium]